MKRSRIIGITLVLGAAAFVAGHAARSAASATRPAPAPAVATAMVGADGPSLPPGRNGDISGLGNLTGADLAPATDTVLELGPTEETAEATAARRAEINAHLTEALGNIDAEKRRQLIDLNDRAVDLHHQLIGELEHRAITHQEYMDRFHDEMINQLAELSGLVTLDQYRALTGLSPGIDPYEFMTSGEGGAPGAATEEPPLTAADLDPEKQRTAGHAGAL